MVGEVDAGLGGYQHQVPAGERLLLDVRLERHPTEAVQSLTVAGERAEDATYAVRIYHGSPCSATWRR